MSHRRIIPVAAGLGVVDTATAQTIAIFPDGPSGSAERLARQVKQLPAILDHLRHLAFHGDTEAQRLLGEIEPAGTVPSQPTASPLA